MPLIKNGKNIENIWSKLEEGFSYKDQPNKLISLHHYLEIYNGLSKSNLGIGVFLDVDDDAMLLAKKLDKLDIVTLNFPSFADGRAFSQARLIRERLKFAGEIRATGHIIRDQFLYLLRSGVNSVDADRATESQWTAAMEELDTFYQPALNRGAAAYHLRHETQAEAA